jgi:hypothetical protein
MLLTQTDTKVNDFAIRIETKTKRYPNELKLNI